MKNKDTEQIRLENRKQIIDYLRVHAPVARVDIGIALSLSPATVTAITSELAADGRLIEVAAPVVTNTARGRPRVLIDLDPNALYVLGLKLSINELRLVLGNQKGDVLKEEVTELRTLDLSEEGLIEALASSVRSFMAQLPTAQRPSAIGIAVQGVVNALSGDIIWSPALTGKFIKIKAPLEKLISMPITVANDANCLAIAVRHMPKYQQLKDFAVVMVGYGIGLGIVVNGELYSGHHGAAAEFGHTKYNPEGAQCLCGKRGCIEAYVGDYALFRDASAMVSLPQDDRLHPTEHGMQLLVDMAGAGNPDITELFARAGKVLGYGMANYIALMSPETVVITGPGVRAFDHMKPGIDLGLNSALVKELMAETTIDKVDWNEDLTLVGVVALALQAID